MATLDFNTTRTYLQKFDFASMFVEILGWSQPKGIKSIGLTVEEINFTATPISQLAGIVVFEVTAENGVLPNAKIRAGIYKEIAKLHHENLLIFLDKVRTQSLWYWVKREEKRSIPREHLYVSGQPGDLFLGKLNAIVVDISELDESGNINVLQVVQRLQKALDVQKVTKKFYTEFATQRLEFIELVRGIDNDHDRRWYASVLLNRMMFIYFLQRKGFVDNGNLEYLQKHLEASKARGKDRYYSEYLNTLFFEGFAKPEEKRTEQAKKILGKIRFLNGGLFLPHPVELNEKYKISIPDEAFENLLKLFVHYSWNLDDTPGGEDDEINPDVLGYIFEKYINQKAFGAFYTRPEITEYLCEQTIYRLILEKVNTPGLPGVLVERKFENIAEMLTNLDAQLCKQLLFDVLPKLSILDPACGSGAFLVAAMRTLINIYSAVMGKIEFLKDKALNDWLAKTRAEHPSLPYFIKRRIITDNLFGVDIMEEATEIARLRLFLALVASVQSVENLEPLPNIDFNILSGNSLIGFLRVDEEAFNRRIGGAGKLEQGNLIPDYVQSGLFLRKTFRQIVDEKQRRVEIYRHASSLTEDLQVLRDDIQHQSDEDYTSLNEMLLDEFSRLDIKYEQAIWDEKKQVAGKARKRGVQIQDLQALHPFHWGYEFDEVMNLRGGFDVIITNPPWDIFKPNAKEFFTEFSDLISKKKMTIKEFEEEQTKLLAQKDLRAAWLYYLSRFPHISAYYRSAPHFENQIAVVNGKKAGSDINLYKLFVEQCYNLLKPNGECGMVIPSGIYTDLGTMQLREMLFTLAQITGLFCFENRKEIFEDLHRSFKFVVLTFEKGGQTDDFPARFMRHDVNELSSFPTEHCLRISVPLVRRLSPDSVSVMEFKSALDIHIAEKMLKFPLLGEEVESKWKLNLTAEFHMTNDSHLFKTQPSKGRLPLYEGKMIWQFEHQYVQPRYWIDEKQGRAAFLGKEQDVGQKLDYQDYRIGIRAVSASTNERSMVSTVLPKNIFCGNSILSTVDGFPNYESLLFCSSLLNSLLLDWLLRIKVTTNINMFYVYQLPIPRLVVGDPSFAPIVERAAKLICTTPEFDDLAKEVGLGSHKNGVTDPATRAHLRAELDGMIAHLYDLTEDEFTHILSTFPLVKQEVKDAAMSEYRKIAPDPNLISLINSG